MMTMQEFLNYCKLKFDDVQITRKTIKSNSFAVVDKKVKDINLAEETSYNIVAKLKNKYANIFTNNLNIEIIECIMEKLENLESIYKEKFIECIPKLSYYQKENKKFNINEEICKILDVNKLKEKNNNILSIESNYEYCYSEKEIINTKGVSIISSKNEYCYFCEITAKNDKRKITLDDCSYKTLNEINYMDICKKLVNNAEKSLESEKIESKKYDIIFSPTIASKIVRSLIGLLSKEEIRKKASCFESKLNQKIASAKLNIIEDPLNENYPAYTGFDDEGILTSKKCLIKDGILKSYLYNNKEAIIENKESTGNGYNTISARNIILMPGQISEEDMIKEVKNGLYIIDFQETGGTVLNNINGQVTAQVFGYIIENGKIKNGFEQSILSTDIFELLNNIKEVGNNLEFKTSIAGSPSVLIENMSIISI